MTTPLSLELTGRRVVVVGAGSVAAAKIATLLEDGADVTVIAPDVDPALASAAVEVVHRSYGGPQDLDRAWLVVAVTGVAAVDDAVVADAEAARIWCVRSGTPGATGGHGSASFMSAVRRGPVMLAASTGGRAPVVARLVREQLGATFGPEYGDLAELLGRLRADPAVQAHLATLTPAARQAAWRSVPLVDILALLRQGAPTAANELAFACLSSSSG